MGDEKVLKQKYNDLLKSYTTGAEYLAEHPEEKEKVEKRLEELSKEISNIMKMFPDMTEKEKNEGFVIDEVEVVDTVDTVDTPKQTETKPAKVEQHQTALQSFSDDWRIANQLAKSTIVPENYKGKPENVVIAVGLARQMDLPPFTVMQNLAIIRGKTSWSGSFCKTLIERTGKFRDLELNYIGEKGKDTYGCYLSAIRVSDGKLIKGPEVTMKMAKEENWTSNKKWLTLTDLMLAYRCQSFFCRLYVPEAMNGIYTSEEVEDIAPNRQQPQDIL